MNDIIAEKEERKKKKLTQEKKKNVIWSSTACHKGREVRRMKTGSPEQKADHYSILRKQSKLRAPPGSVHSPFHFFRGEVTAPATSATKLTRD